MAKLLETFYEVLFSTNFMQVKASFHLQTGLIPDILQISLLWLMEFVTPVYVLWTRTLVVMMKV